jgi:hypothetical protein
MDGVPADEVGGEGDGVGLGHEEFGPPLSMIAASRPMPGPRTTRGHGVDFAEEACKEFAGELACVHGQKIPPGARALSNARG